MGFTEGQKYTVSDVIDHLGINAGTWVMFIFLGFAMIFDGYDFMVASQTTSGVASTLQFFLDPTGANAAIATVTQNATTGAVSAGLAALGSSISTWSLLGMVIGGAVGGIISDKIGRKKTLTIAIIFYGLFTLPQAFATDFAFYAATRVIAGLGVGSCIPVVTTCFSETIPSKNRGIFVTFGMAFMVVGWVLAGVVVTWLNTPGMVIQFPLLPDSMYQTFTLSGKAADGSVITTNTLTQNWRIGYLIGALPVIYGVLLGLFMRETPHWYANTGKADKAVARLEQFVKQAGQNIKLDASLITVPPRLKSASPKVLFTRKFIVATAAIWTMYFIGQVFVYGLNPWMIPMMTGFGYTPADASAMQTFNNVAAICSNVSVGFVSDKLGRKKTLIFSWLFTALAVVVFALLVGPNNFGLCMFLFFLIGYAMNFAITGVQPLMPESYPTQVRNTGVSWCQAFARFGGAAAPIVFSAITAMSFFKVGGEATGASDWNKIMFLLLIPAAIGVICTVIFVRKETSGKDLDTLVTEAVGQEA